MHPTVVPMRENPAVVSPPASPPANAAPARSATAARSAFWPLLPLALAVLAWLAHQAWVLDQERRQFEQALRDQQAAVDQAGTLRRTLDLLAADTQRLADAGNGNARALVDELRRRGITIQTPSAAPAPAASAGGR